MFRLIGLFFAAQSTILTFRLSHSSSVFSCVCITCLFKVCACTLAVGLFERHVCYCLFLGLRSWRKSKSMHSLATTNESIALEIECLGIEVYITITVSTDVRSTCRPGLATHNSDRAPRAPGSSDAAFLGAGLHLHIISAKTFVGITQDRGEKNVYNI